MRLLMISGDRSMLAGKQGAFWYTLEAFSKEWERIDVICPMNEASSDKLQAPSFFANVFFHPAPKGLWYQPQWILKRGKQLANIYRHDVMTVHEYPPFFNGIGAWRLSAATGIPYVLEVHHLVGYPVPASLQERIGQLLSRVYLPIAGRRADAIRTVSKDTAQTLMRWRVPQEKIRVVPSFYLDRSFFESLPPRPSLQYDVVFCGRLVANKGIPALLKAIASLPKARLLVIGDGPERKKLSDMASALGILHRTEFKGWLPTQTDVMQAIRSAKMLVMNSLSEGGPRVPLEAMAAGVPVIVTRVGVMPDVIVDGVNGFFTTGEPEDLAQKIERLITHDAIREKMGGEARAILERFERGRLIGQYARFLQAFAKTSPHSL